MKIRLCLLFALLTTTVFVFAGTEPELKQSSETQVENSLELFSTESTYTFSSDFQEDSRLGHVSSLYSDFSYDHRFLITGKWYLRTGVEYERYDFDGTDNGLPDHLQALFGHVALEYVVKNFAGAGIEVDPGVFYQNSISGDDFDIPWKAY